MPPRRARPSVPGRPDKGQVESGLAALAVGLLAAVLHGIWRSRRRRSEPTPGQRRFERVAVALSELLPVIVVFLAAGGLFGLGWLLPDMWFVGLTVLTVDIIGFVVWCTRVVPWPRE